MSLPYTREEDVAPGGEVTSQLANKIQDAIILNRTDLEGLSGVWTPEVRIGAVGNAPITLTASFAEYTIHDLMGVLFGYVTFSNTTAGTVFITGLPVAPSNRINQIGGSGTLKNLAAWTAANFEVPWTCEADDAGDGNIRLYNRETGAYLSNNTDAGSKTIIFHAVFSRQNIVV
jgi:hypothetical protein